MKKLIGYLFCLCFVTNVFGQYNPAIWEVIDETTQVQALTGLNHSNGIYELEKRELIYSKSWESDILHVDFTNPVGDNWADFGFMFIYWEGETGNRFTTTTERVPQNSDIAKGFSVDFTNEANRSITFKVQASADLNLRMDLYDIQGKCSNHNSPKSDILATSGGIDINDDTKWQVVTYSWGGDATANATVYDMNDMYSESWWGTNNTGLRDDYVLLNAAKIGGISFTIDDGEQGIDGEQKTIYIKDVIIGASEEKIEYYRDSIIVCKKQLHNLIEVDEYNATIVNNMVDNGTIEVGLGANQILPEVYSNFTTQLNNAKDIYNSQTATLEEIQIAYDSLQVSIDQMLDKYFYLTVSTTGIVMDFYNNGEETFIINSNTSWEISGIEPWFSVSQVSGIGNQTIQITPTNNGGLQRSALLVISAKGDVKQMNITQNENENEPCSNYTLNNRLIGDTLVCTNSDQTLYTVEEMRYYPSSYIWTVSGNHLNYSHQSDNSSIRYVDWGKSGIDTITLHEITWDGCEVFDTLIVRIYDCLLNPSYQNKPLELQYNAETNVVTFKGIQGEANIVFLDISGKTIYTKTIISDDSISTEFLPQGVYIVQVNSESGNVQMKLVKK